MHGQITLASSSRSNNGDLSKNQHEAVLVERDLKLCPPTESMTQTHWQRLQLIKMHLTIGEPLANPADTQSVITMVLGRVWLAAIDSGYSTPP